MIFLVKTVGKFYLCTFLLAVCYFCKSTNKLKMKNLFCRAGNWEGLRHGHESNKCSDVIESYTWKNFCENKS